jgi:hypothetical protein
MAYYLDLQIFYFVGFGLFCLESLLSMWVIQVKLLAAAALHSVRLLTLFTWFLNP